MRVIKPLPITPAMLVSTTATETYPEYVPGFAYALNSFCTMASTGRLYKCIQSPSTGHSPDTSPLWWTDAGPSNTWAMFDGLISTQTEHAGSLTVVVKPGICNSISLFNLEGTSLTITARDGLSGPVVYSNVIDLDGTIITDWYQYYFEPFVQKGSVVLTDLPPYSDIHITITVASGSNAGIGHLSVGTFYEIGDAQSGATIGIIDYSKKTTTTDGITSLQPGNYSDRLNMELMLLNAQLRKIKQVLTSLRGTACSWVGSDLSTLDALTVRGFFRDFSIVIQYVDYSLCSIEIEGMS